MSFGAALGAEGGVLEVGLLFFGLLFLRQAGDRRLKSKGRRPGRFVCVNYHDPTGRQGAAAHLQIVSAEVSDTSCII